MIKSFIKNLYQFKCIFSNYKKEIFLFLAMDMLCILCLVISPALVSQILICVLNKQYSMILFMVVFLLLTKILYLFLSFFSTKFFLSFRRKFSVDMKNIVSEKIIDYSIDSFRNNRKGKFINRIIEDMDEVPNHLSYIRDYLKVLFTNLFTIFYIIKLNFVIGFLYFIALILMILIKSVGVKYKNKYTGLNLIEKEKTSNDVTEVYNGIQDIKQLNLKVFFNKKISTHFENSETYQYKGDFINNIFYILSMIIEWGCTLIVIFIGIIFIEKNSLSVDDFITIFMYRNIIFSVDGCMSYLILRMSLFNLSCERVFEICDLNNKVIIENKDDNICAGKIKFDKVSFGYGKKMVLNRCSFDIKPNSIYAIVGKSGAGKTTILNLLTGLYKATYGNILLDDRNIDEYNTEFIHSNISIISQNYYIFDISITDNLLLAKPSASKKEIIDVCMKVGLHDDIMRFDNKYDTIVGEGASFLSGGQKQRIAIARALLMDKKIILFDEATASLDSNLESDIFDLIYKMKKNHTILFISHNINLIKKIPNILVLENGKITCMGNHDYLYKNNKLYKSLVDQSR